MTSVSSTSISARLGMLDLREPAYDLDETEFKLINSKNEALPDCFNSRNCIDSAEFRCCEEQNIDAILSLKKLRSIYGYRNLLQHLPERLGDLKQLRTFSWRYGNLNGIPASIRNLTHLIHLDLRGNSIRVVPNGIMELANLLSLDLSENCIEMLPDHFDHFRALKTLKVSSNKLSELPASVNYCPSLEEIDISKNHFIEFPLLDRLLLLRDLNAANNMLVEVPEWIANLNSLNALDCSYNRISILPRSIVQLSSKCELFLFDHRLKTSVAQSLQREIELQRRQDPTKGPQLTNLIQEGD